MSELIEKYTPTETTGSRDIVKAFLDSGLEASTVNMEQVGNGTRNPDSVYSSLRSYCSRHKVNVKVSMRGKKIVLTKESELAMKDVKSLP